LVELLLKHPQINVNPVDKSLKTLFFLACSHGYANIVKMMLPDQRVDVEKPNGDDGHPPLWIAISQSNLFEDHLLEITQIQSV